MRVSQVKRCKTFQTGIEMPLRSVLRSAVRSHGPDNKSPHAASSARAMRRALNELPGPNQIRRAEALGEARIDGHHTLAGVAGSLLLVVESAQINRAA